MNAVVVYFSKFGNTKKVAEAVAQGLGKDKNVRIVSSAELAPADFDAVDLVVVGSPTHKMNLPESVRQVFDQLPHKILKGKLIAAFDTSYKMSGWLNHFTAGKKLTRKLCKLGGKRITPPEIFLVAEREGPLFEGEITRAKEWGASILNLLQRTV